ncbi:lipoprotein N-acyltransferase Lnb domain-containing protein [Chondromyces apiculatus]|uniref:Lnb N-terminal periplasmic domain-containing protein n=1 Tax=Chondromyces apiculatus DSM 436 TaxID=1192034 RepID=A0A017SYA4_9BACT|nr:DUF4105 domain-containing protein [Chondromyces apiculatus]EYF01560.1 Hypothetical protein CAP_8000 [Chondromyces apiculatus DSM 436]
MRRLALFVFIPAFILAGIVLGSPRGAAAAPGDSITISVLTYGPGSSPFDKFGHQAIRVRDTGKHGDLVYNFGTYSFGGLMAIPKFVMGRALYSLSRRSYKASTDPYIRADRSIVEQVLNLTPEQRLEVKQRLETNLLPANRDYKYDYYLDNCATRPRDLVDAVIGGRLREASRGPASLTFRQHTQRLTAGTVPFYVALHLAMGPFIDRPIDQWDEMFLPERVEERLRHVTVVGPSAEEPLVTSERVIHASSRTPPPAAPPSWTWWFLAVGLGLGGALAGLGAAGRARRGARVAFGSVLAVLGFGLGLFGILLTFLWVCTDHAVTYRNENILQLAPWTIALVVYGVGVARGRERATRVALGLVGAAAVASLLGLLLKAVPVFRQDNAAFIAFALPMWSGAAVGAWLLFQRFAKAPSAAPEAVVSPAEGASG